ncbi:MAG TPA: hypothetical protein EYH03_03710 [Chromatiales bacterium]|nr:hypothetical protein [Chromatiales bacterium]
MQELRILHQDEHYVAIDKPDGLLVHRTRLADERRAALQLLRDQIGRRLYMVHLLDRPTSGVLVFGLSAEAARLLTRQFEQRKVEKRYLGVVRGYTGEGRHNRFFRERFGIQRLLLMAWSLGFYHPYEGRWLTLKVAPDEEWQSLFRALGWEGVMRSFGR